MTDMQNSKRGGHALCGFVVQSGLEQNTLFLRGWHLKISRQESRTPVLEVGEDYWLLSMKKGWLASFGK